MLTDLNFTLALSEKFKDQSYLSHKNCFIGHVVVRFRTQLPTFKAVKTTLIITTSGGQFEPDKGGQFAPDSGGHFQPDRGGQFDRIFQVDLEIKETPEEILANNFLKIRKNLALELLSKVKTCTPAFFENLVVELLVKMGYGGTIKEAGKTTRLTNDGGIDGIIKEDKLGLDFIYIQAKRWDNQSVGRPDIQSFVGALDGQRATKGVFITTSKFADTAQEYVKTITKKVILIDGEQLTNYMIDYGLGVSTFTTYDLKKIDNDYFGDE